MNLVGIALGGALGALARYGLSGWIHARVGAEFPWGTLGVNVLGSFLIGLGLSYLQHTSLPPEAREFLAIGLLGAFTTFSTFTWETAALLQDGEWARAGLYVGGSLILGLAAVLVGLGFTEAFLRLRR